MLGGRLARRGARPRAHGARRRARVAGLRLRGGARPAARRARARPRPATLYLSRPGSTPSGSAPGSGISSAAERGDASRSARSRRARRSSNGGGAEERTSEDRHHLLPDLRRLRRGRDRARDRARRARPRGALHHVPAAVPAPGVPAARLLPRGGRRPLSALPVSAVRPRARGAHARGRDQRGARPPPRALRHPARDQRVDREGDAAQGRPRHHRDHHAARHRHHDRRAGPLVPRHHQVLDREIRPRHRGVAVPQGRDRLRLRLCAGRRRGDPQLRRSRRVRPVGARAGAARASSARTGSS